MLALCAGLWVNPEKPLPEAGVEKKNNEEIMIASWKCGPPPIPPPPQIEEAFVIVTEPPLFPGCEDLGSYAEKKVCANKKLLTFIYGNLKTPELAKSSCCSGVVVASFVVEKNGTIGNVEVLRDPGCGYGAEVTRVINQMNPKGIRFNPCRSGGRASRYRYTIPINITLQ